MASLADINIRFRADLKGFSTQMQSAQRSLEKTGKKLQNVGGNLTAGLTLPLLGIGTLAVKTFADFEDAMAKVNAISGATDKQFKLLTEDAKRLGATTRYSATEVSALQLAYSKLGFNPDEIIEATEATLDLALATGEDLAQSATVAASTLRGFGLSADETTRVTDVMAKSFSSSALDLNKFQVAMSVLAPVAKTAGVSLEQATGLLSTLVNAGVDASTAGTGLRNVFLDIADKGLTMEEALGKIQTSTNKNKTAMELFGKRGATVANILADNVIEAQNFTTAYLGAAGSASKMADIMDNTLQGAFFRLKSSVEGAFISIGEQIAPVLLRVTEYISSLVTKFNELSPTTKKWIVIIGGIAAAIGPLLALAGTILPAILTGFTILTGPIGLIAAALTAIGVIIYKNWAPIKKTLLDIANYFVDLYNESIVFKIAVEAVVATFKTLFEIGKFVFETLKNIIGSFIDNFVTGFKTIGKIIKAVLTGNISEIPDIIKTAQAEGIKNFGGFTKELAKDWEGLVDGIQKTANEGIANVTSRKKLTYFKDNVDASGITEAVSDATKKGIAQGSQNKGTGVGRKTTIENEVELADIDAKLAELDTIDDFLASTGDNFRQAIENADTSILLGSMSEQYEGFINDTEDNLVAPFQEKMQRLTEIGNAVGDSVASAFEGLSGRIVDSLGLASTGFEGFIKGLVQTVTKLISIMLAQSISQSIAGATASGAATGPASIFTTPAFIAQAVSGVIAAFASIPKFATGGVVGGSSFYGDQILARVNSGELILNQSQQKNLAGMLNENTAQDVRVSGDFKLVGSDLVASFNRENLKQSRRS